jgi:hypothetical protein
MIPERELPLLAQKLKPFMLPWIEAGAGAGAGGGGGLAAHVLATPSGLGPFHLVSGLSAGQALVATGASAARFAALQHSQLGGVTANQHHNQAHLLATNAGLGSDHTMSGATAGHVLRASSSTTAAFAQLQHGDLGGVTADQHHAQLHGITDAAHHSIGGSNYDVVGKTGAGALGLIPSNSNVSGVSVETLVRATAAGASTFKDLIATVNVQTPAISTGGGDLALNPASGIATVASLHTTTRVRSPLVENATGDLKLDASTDLIRVQASVRLQSDNYASQVTGWGIDYTGGADFRYLFVDEMHAKSFIADLEQALAGGQIISKSVAVVYANFTLPAASGSTTFVVRDLPSATGMACFVNGDIVRFRKFTRAAGSLTIADAWGVVTLDTSYGVSGFDAATKTQRYSFVRSAGGLAGTASGTIAADALVLDYGTSGNGIYEVNAIDGAYALNSPYLQFIKWTTHPQNGQEVRLRLGNLRGITAQADEYGLFAGDGVTDADSYIRLSSFTNRLNNLPMEWWIGGTKAVSVDTTSGINIVATGAYDYDRSYSFSYGGVLVGGVQHFTNAGACTTRLVADRTTVAGGDASVDVDAVADTSGIGTVTISGETEGGRYGRVAAAATATTAAVAIDLYDGTNTANYDFVSTYAAFDKPLRLTYGGTNATPNLQFGDVDTGFYAIAAGQINATINGTDRLAITATGLAVTGSVDVSTSVLTPIVNETTGVAVQYNGATKLATTSGGVAVTGTLDASTSVVTPIVNETTGVSVQFNGSTKIATKTDGVTVTGEVDASAAYARSGTTGYIFVPLVVASLTDGGSVQWTGSVNKTEGTYTFDMAAAANGSVPTAAKAVLVLFSCQFATASNNSYIAARPRGGSTNHMAMRGLVANISLDLQGVVGLDATYGDIEVVVTGATANNCVARLLGYYI